MYVLYCSDLHKANIANGCIINIDCVAKAFFEDFSTPKWQINEKNKVKKVGTNGINTQSHIFTDYSNHIPLVLSYRFADKMAIATRDKESERKGKESYFVCR